VPDGPLLVIANEFFDALPIRQFEKTPMAGPSGWSIPTREREIPHRAGPPPQVRSKR
jgi:SAM-dependent MidA family methyltransferase